MVAYGHQIISHQSIPGVSITAQTSDKGITAKIVIDEGRQVVQPIHLCFGLFERFGVQNVALELVVGANAKATLWSHCLFSVPDVARHAMEAVIRIGPGAELRYQEAHYHGASGGMEVVPRALVTLERGARLFSDFSLVTGLVGKLDVDFDVNVGEDAVAELTSKVFGHGTDKIKLKERLVLAGRNARGLIKSRMAVEDDASAEVIGMTEGNAAGARGHVDCTEIIKDRGVVSASPIVRVTHPEAKVTHEAAIGSVDRQQMETLMARGLTPEEAVYRIVGGLLR
ncbi:putative FeS assembly protein SufBD (plasmid) [Sulfuricella denitrificans skB26]|uniref:Putative FeS assembly protein SufBD n=1 Tax=Sulfuricella denitrificans (strain DSM 22764 / NBRC 105220 / skB26) TaxID=1163617 RepID=S6AE26_SULDS|nr:putative FeS assembly protein SufBD [Sulfuricella denitrificans skB26]